jgi:gluconokinase
MFPPSLVESQFATLESPVGEAGVLRMDAALQVAQISELVCAWLRNEVRKESV